MIAITDRLDIGGYSQARVTGKPVRRSSRYQITTGNSISANQLKNSTQITQSSVKFGTWEMSFWTTGYQRGQTLSTRKN